MSKQYSYNFNEYDNELYIYEGNMILSTVSCTKDDNHDELFKEVVYELRNIDLDKE